MAAPVAQPEAKRSRRLLWAVKGQIEGSEISSSRLLLVQKVGNVVHGELSSESLYHVGNSEYSDPLYFDLNLSHTHRQKQTNNTPAAAAPTAAHAHTPPATAAAAPVESVRRVWLDQPMHSTRVHEFCGTAAARQFVLWCVGSKVYDSSEQPWLGFTKNRGWHLNFL